MKKPNKNSYTIAYTSKEEYGVKFNGWLNEGELQNRCHVMGFGVLIDYIHCNTGDVISSPFKKEMNKSNTNLVTA